MQGSPLAYTQNGYEIISWWKRDGESEKYNEPDSPEEPSSVHKPLITLTRFIYENQRLRRKYDLLHGRIYANLRFLGFGLNTYSKVEGIEDDRITLNICKNMVNAVTSRITKQRVRVNILTDGEDYTVQRRAKLLEQFVDGQFYRTKFRNKAVDAFRDAAIYGTGFLKVFPKNGQIAVEHVPPWLLSVDENEALMGDPRNLFERRYIDKHVLLETFAKDKPELQRKINEIKVHVTDEEDFGRDSTSDQVLVTEAWHLPSGPEAGDGRHVICVDNATLLDEEWKYDHFPYVSIRWSKSPHGYFGMGLISELLGIHAEIQKLLRQIQQAHHLCGWPRVFVPRTARIIKQQLNNQIGAIIDYDGPTPPTQASFPVVPSEIYSHLQFLIKNAYEVAGISQLTATSSKPAGIDSGVALRTLQDVQSDRFADVARAFEDLHVQAAELMIELGRDLGKSDSNFAVKAIGKEDLKEIKWDEAVLEMEQYVVQCFPTSMLPQEPAGRLSFVNDLAAILKLDPVQTASLLDFPDVKTTIKRATVARDIVDFNIESILQEGIYIEPQPFEDLKYAQARCQQEINRLRKQHSVPMDTVEMLHRYISQADELTRPAEPPVQSPPMPGGAPVPPPGPGPNAPPNGPPGPPVPPNGPNGPQ